MQLLGEGDGVKEIDVIGTDVDAGANLGEFRCLLVDLHFEALPTQRDGRRQSAEARSDNCNAPHFTHLILREADDRWERSSLPSVVMGMRSGRCGVFDRPLAMHQFTVTKGRVGSDSAARVTDCRDRYSSNTGLECGKPWRPFRAISDQSAVQQKASYSITSLAAARSVCGMPHRGVAVAVAAALGHHV